MDSLIQRSSPGSFGQSRLESNALKMRFDEKAHQRRDSRFTVPAR
jgi:hypothetical protein